MKHTIILSALSLLSPMLSLGLTLPLARAGTSLPISVHGGNYLVQRVGSKALVVPQNYVATLQANALFRRPDCRWVDEQFRQIKQYLPTCGGVQNHDDPMCDVALELVKRIRESRDPSHGGALQSWQLTSPAALTRASRDEISSTAAAALQIDKRDVLVQIAPVVSVGPGVDATLVSRENSRAGFIQAHAGLAPAQLSYGTNNRQFITQSLDVACDLIDGNASIAWTQTSVISAPIPHLLRADLMWQVRETLRASGQLGGESDIERAASLGFRLHDALLGVGMTSEAALPETLDALIHPATLEVLPYSAQTDLVQRKYMLSTEISQLSFTASTALTTEGSVR